jgi:hypothetical protein
LFVVHPDIDFFSGNDKITTRYGQIAINQAEVALDHKVNPVMIIYEDGNSMSYHASIEKKLTVVRFSAMHTAERTQIQSYIDD